MTQSRRQIRKARALRASVAGKICIGSMVLGVLPIGYAMAALGVAAGAGREATVALFNAPLIGPAAAMALASVVVMLGSALLSAIWEG